jgi:predicted HicB family RNase H-like nuclease
VFNTPWPGDPRVNIQNDKGKAKAYQVRQVLKAIDRRGQVMGTMERPEVDVSHYTYRAVWSVEDGEFVATVAEFASLSWLAASQVEALQGLEAVLTDVVADMQEHGEDVPEPFSERSYSGKFNLRLGEKLHREVALRAAEENLSINQWVVRKLMVDG